MAVTIKMDVFQVLVPCDLVEVNISNVVIAPMIRAMAALMKVAARTSQKTAILSVEML